MMADNIVVQFVKRRKIADNEIGGISAGKMWWFSS